MKHRTHALSSRKVGAAMIIANCAAGHSPHRNVDVGNKSVASAGIMIKRTTGTASTAKHGFSAYTDVNKAGTDGHPAAQKHAGTANDRYTLGGRSTETLNSCLANAGVPKRSATTSCHPA